MRSMQAFAVPGLPEVRPGDDLAGAIVTACETARLPLRSGDVLAVAQKIVSKAQGRIVALEDVTPSLRAHELATETGKDPRLVELILAEARAVVRHRPGLLIVEHRLGFVCANAGIDRSNVPQGTPGRTFVTLLPVDPDRSATELRDALAARLGVQVAVLVLDTHGRAHREGAVGVAIGVAGLQPLTSMVGWCDRHGYRLRSTVVATADELAAAASLLMGQSAEGHPVVVLRGTPYRPGEGSAQSLVRKPDSDVFC